MIQLDVVSKKVEYISWVQGKRFSRQARLSFEVLLRPGRPADAGPPPLPAARCIYLESRWRPFLGGPGASAPRNLHEGEEGHPHHRDRGPCRRQRPWQLGVIDSACQHSFARPEAWRAGASLLNRAHHLGPHGREDRCGRLQAAAPTATSRPEAGSLANL